jgi:cell division protein FtsB
MGYYRHGEKSINDPFELFKIVVAANVDLGIWSKLTRVVIFLLFLAGVLGVVIWYLPLIQRNERARKEILNMDSQIKVQEDHAKHLENSIKSLRNDPRTVERVAREKLGYLKPGEVMIKFEEAVAGSIRTSPPR